MAQETGQDQAVHSHEPTQSAPSRVGTALRHLGWDKDRQYPEPETLFDDYAGRSKAVADHDMGIDRTFTDLDAKLRPAPNMTPEQIAQWNAYYEPRNEAFRKANLSGKELVRWRYNRYMHDYLACVKAVDENIGRLLKYLDEEGLADNTIIMCSSDQGFYLGSMAGLISAGFSRNPCAVP